MKKEFSISVPDEYWIDSWKDNKTVSWIYEGPEKVYVLMSKFMTMISWQEEELTVEDDSPEKVIVVDADKNTDVAHFLVSMNQEHVYEFAETENHDGSIYKFFVNPRIQDLFYLDYEPLKGLLLRPIYRKTETIQEIEAKKRKQYVLENYNRFEFDDQVNQTVKDFIKNVDNYLESMKTIYPWKYVEISNADIPKIPLNLVTKFNELPKLGDEKNE